MAVVSKDRGGRFRGMGLEEGEGMMAMMMTRRRLMIRIRETTVLRPARNRVLVLIRRLRQARRGLSRRRVSSSKAGGRGSGRALRRGRPRVTLLAIEGIAHSRRRCSARLVVGCSVEEVVVGAEERARGGLALLPVLLRLPVTQAAGMNRLGLAARVAGECFDEKLGFAALRHGLEQDGLDA